MTPALSRGADRSREHDALDAVFALKRAGKVRFVGMSSTLPHLADHIAMGVFDVFQIPGIVIRGGAFFAEPGPLRVLVLAPGTLHGRAAEGPF